jgi:hypothetical protein
MKIKATLGIGFCKADRETEIDIDDDELEGMTEEEQNEYINETVQTWADNYIDIGWEKED